ncbi:SCF ubiquitin ligase complex subunit cdc4 [Kluyveromyces marxianus]|uniref:WD40 domain n=2 Tax=Kluyveromyces marxianus TaxID=4911 RepID=W0T849_KLUMD|nr:WD40 domain-containing protein [Kluyveromyces marxianus DMKU3-1042]KAG0672791.1 SCF ubiquitin ligase complex subunit cdc4 [Kluyveromyces marxianus]KAG0678126.1 SCF ubiquitin ligase complex subunit cdc4 [Kluyveromyces marxianus]QGN14955.1 WD40 domain [Kluyveromyces marxianus]BAO39233.1 WD40 domain [Kluyveromyces marxianus DMKU3-1042]BAP70745.1 WD40 domain [Kluyveromyces marxianus]
MDNNMLATPGVPKYPLQDVPVPYRYQLRPIASSQSKRAAATGAVHYSSQQREDGSEDEEQCHKRMKPNQQNVSSPGLAEDQDGPLPISPIASPCHTPKLEEPSIDEVIGTAISRLSGSTPHANGLPSLIFRLVSNMDRTQLSDLVNIIADNLKRDLFHSLPNEITVKILLNLSSQDIFSCLLVNKNWNKLIKDASVVWKRLMLNEGFVTHDQFPSYCNGLPSKYNHLINPDDRFRLDFLENNWLLQNWYDPSYKPGRTCLDGHSTNVVTCLQFENNYIITGADDKKINVYDAENDQFLLELNGHEGGVWALKFVEGNILVSGSTDRSIRIWNIETGKCTHVFKGHTSTVRCVEVVEYNGTKYVITGSRDNTLHVWKLPMNAEPDKDNREPAVFNTTDENPYFVGVLRGHMSSVRTVSGHGRIIVSGSYDHNLMVWDIIDMKLLYILTGHTDRVYCTIYDHKRNRCISASMDTTVRVWDLENIKNNGTISSVFCNNTTTTKVSGSMKCLYGHTALVGLLCLSDKFLVSAAADGSLRGWDSNDYSRKFSFHHTNLAAITSFSMNDNILVSGSERQFNVYNLRTGKLIHRKLLTDAEQVWGIKFNNRKLVAAIESVGHSYVEILDFATRNGDKTLRTRTRTRVDQQIDHNSLWSSTL